MTESEKSFESVVSDDKIDYKGVGERIQYVRKVRGIRQTDLAKTIGVSYQYMSMIENGRRKLSLSAIVRLASELQVSVDFLLNGSRETVSGVPGEDILEIFRDLKPREREIVLAIAQSAKKAFREYRNPKTDGEEGTSDKEPSNK